MEQHYNSFLTTFYKFIFDLNRYDPTIGTSKALEVYKDLDFAKVIFRTYHLLKDNNVKIRNKDETLFNNPFIVLPDVDVSQSWSKLIKGQKNKLFTYLTILLIETDILFNQLGQETSNTPSKKLNTEPEAIIKLTENTTGEITIVVKAEDNKNSEFNPYVGVGENNNQQYSVDEMFSSLANMEDEETTVGGIGLESIVKMIGLNKIVDFNELTNQLKNMKKEDIENATNDIKKMLGDKVDAKTTTLITDLLTNISEEMKSSDMTKGDPFKHIIKIAESVAGKMKPQIEKGDLDVSQLGNSVQMFADNCKDKDGKPMFEGTMNPFAMLSQFTNITGSKNANNANNNKENSANGTQEQCLQQCTDMLKSMGMNNIDLKNMNMQDMMAQVQRTMGQRPPGSQESQGSSRSARPSGPNGGQPNCNNIRGGKKKRRK